MLALEIITVVVSIIAAWLLSKPKLSGMYLRCFASILWLVFCILAEFYVAAGMNTIYLVIAIIGVKNWKKQKIGL